MAIGLIKGSRPNGPPCVPFALQALARVDLNVDVSADARVGTGISIGENVLIDAMSVVNREFPAFTVAADVPVHVLRAQY